MILCSFVDIVSSRALNKQIIIYKYAGLFHGKDIRFGSSISHSHARSNRCWKPNVQNKRLWSDVLNDWVRFKITTAGIKAVDDYGGIDNYIMYLDDRLVEDSNYVTKMRSIITSALYHKGELPEKVSIHLGYHKNPPPVYDKNAKWIPKPEALLQKMNMKKK